MTPEQAKKASSYNKSEMVEGDLTDRHMVRLVQYWQEGHQLKADGFAGPQTQRSIDVDTNMSWGHVRNSTKITDEDQFIDGLWLPWDGPLAIQPKNYEEAIKFFGMPETSKGSDVLDKKWFKANIVERQGKKALPGVPPKWYFKMHRVVEPYMREGLRRARLSCPQYTIDRIGGFVFRHIRHDPRRRLSTHALGCAFDVNSRDNRAVQFKRGKAPKAWSPEYMKIWPNGVPQAFVQAMSSVGFAWGSDWDEDGKTEDHTFLDPMHFEWIARDGNSIEV